MPLMTLVNTETKEKLFTRDMSYNDRDQRNSLLDMVPYVWEEVNK